jgi:hypothetical protein
MILNGFHVVNVFGKVLCEDRIDSKGGMHDYACLVLEMCSYFCSVWISCSENYSCGDWVLVLIGEHD